MVTKRRDSKPASGPPAVEGDLFPRGPAQGSVARIRKRDGTLLFGASDEQDSVHPTKRRRSSGHPADHAGRAPSVRDSPTAALAMSAKRMSVGMTLLAVVETASVTAVVLELPGGVRARADPMECLVVLPARGTRGAASAFSSLRNSRSRNAEVVDSDSEDGMNSESDDAEDREGNESQGENTRIRHLYEVVVPGDLVRVAVVSVERSPAGSWKVVVSCRPNLVNANVSVVGATVASGRAANALSKGELMWGAVKATEDHGYVVDFGSAIPTLGFLNFSDTEPGVRLYPGSPVDVLVTEAQRVGRRTRQVVRVSHMVGSTTAAITQYTQDMNFAFLRAGIRVRARVVRVEDSGSVELRIFGLFSAAVERTHVPFENPPAVDATVDTRLLYVDAGAKRVGATLLPELVKKRKLRTVPSNWTVGRVVVPVRVVHVISGFGVMLEMCSDQQTGDHESARLPMFAHVSKIADERTERLEEKFTPGLVLPAGARVTSIARLDGVANVDLRPSILSRKALAIEEVKVGERYDCKIVSHSTAGSLIVGVDGDARIRGVVPASQISDTFISVKRLVAHPKFKVGATLACICIAVDEDKGKVILTSKRSLLHSDRPILSSFKQAKAALVAANASGHVQDCIFDGTVATVTDNLAVLVIFSGGVRGLVARDELALDDFGIEARKKDQVDTARPGDDSNSNGKSKKAERTKKEIEGLFPVGQTVRARIVRVDVDAERMWLSFRLERELDPVANSGKSLLSIGTAVQGTVFSTDESARAFVVQVPVSKKGAKNCEGNSSTGGSTDETTRCILPYDHLSDFADICSRLTALYLKQLQDGADSIVISAAVVLELKNEVPVLSAKQSLLRAKTRGALPACMTEVVAIHEADLARNESVPGMEDSVYRSQRTVLRGYVRAALSSGAVIGFLGSTAGFVRKSRISDEFVADPSKAVRVHQSVAVVVDGVDSEKSRFTLSMRSSDVGLAPLEDDSESYFDSFRDTCKTYGSQDVERDFAIGSVVNASVDAPRNFGSVLRLTSAKGTNAVAVALDDSQGAAVDIKELAENVKGAVPESVSFPKHSGEKEQKKKSGTGASGEPRRVRVLDVDPFSGVVDVSADSKVVNGASKRSVSLEVGRTVQGTILLVKDSYVVLSLPLRKGRTDICFALLPVLSLGMKFEIRRGASVSCRTLSSQTGRNVVIADWDAMRNGLASQKRTTVVDDGGMSSKRWSGSMPKDALHVGMKVAGRVSAVFQAQVNVAVARGVVGRVHITNCGERLRDIDSLPLGQLPAELKRKFVLPAVGTELRDLTVTEIRGQSPDNTSSKGALQLELKVSGQDNENDSRELSLSSGTRCVAYVKHLKKNESGRIVGAWCMLTPTISGFCRAVDAILPPAEAGVVGNGTNALTTLSAGSPILGEVTSIDSSRVRLSFSSNGRKSHLPAESWKEPFFGIVSEIDEREGIKIELPFFSKHPDFSSKHWGLVSLCDIDDDYDCTTKLLERISIGDVVRVKHVKAGEGENCTDVLYLSMRHSVLSTLESSRAGDVKDPLLTVDKLTQDMVGNRVRGFVRSVGKTGCFVNIGRQLVARILLSDLADEYVKEPETDFPVGKLVAGKFTGVDGGKIRKVCMSLRKRERKVMKDKTTTGMNKKRVLEEGQVVLCCVQRIEQFGAIVRVEGAGTALLHNKEADQDRVVLDPWAEWSVGQWLTVVVITPSSTGKEGGGKGGSGQCHRVGTKQCYFEAAGLDKESVDDVMDRNAKQKSTKEEHENGLIALLQSPGSPKAQMDLQKQCPDIVTLIADSDDSKDDGSGTGGGGDDDDDDDDDVDHNDDDGDSDVVLVSARKVLDQDSESSVQEVRPGSADLSEVSSGSDKSDRPDSDFEHSSESMAEEADMVASDSDRDNSAVDTLPIPQGFSFDDDDKAGTRDVGDEQEQDNDPSPTSLPDAGNNTGHKKSSKEKRQKKKAKELAERELLAREEALANRADTPETAEDFERLVMAEPNGSHVWIRYIAFRVSLSQFDKARAIAERALGTIALTEELERVNIWIAYINLEALHGSVDAPRPTDGSGMDIAALKRQAASVFRIFDRACQRVTDVEDFHLQVASALRASCPEIADEVLKRALQKFKSSPAVWVAMGTASFVSGDFSSGRQMLERALLSLERVDHVEVIMKFARLEYRFGTRERARTIFESLIGNFPKRIDLWSVYLDMEISTLRKARKSEELEDTEAACSFVRRIFERAVTLDLSTKKTKYIFKRWLGFEVDWGDKQSQAAVRAKAREYVETRLVSI